MADSLSIGGPYRGCFQARKLFKNEEKHVFFAKTLSKLISSAFGGAFMIIFVDRKTRGLSGQLGKCLGALL